MASHRQSQHEIAHCLYYIKRVASGSIDRYRNSHTTICEQWSEKGVGMLNFIHDMYPSYQKGLEIGRRDTTFGFTPENTIWVKPLIKSHRKRKPEGKTSQYQGVSWSKTRNKWVAQIKIKGKTTSLGRHETETAAAIAYDNSSMVEYGDYAVLNFS